ncbi:MAG: AMP-binding protein [Rhodobacteraceae bacterium]|nr:AMP-binding protein [Paracoccaceae bacterium]
MIEFATETIHGLFATAAARWPDRPMLNVTPGTGQVYGIAAGEISYADAALRVDSLARAFQRLGFGSGMRIALLMENRPDFFLYFLALNRLGASVVPINPDLRAAELTYLIGHAEPAAVLAIPARVADLSAAVAAAHLVCPVASSVGGLVSPRANAIVAHRNPDPTEREAAVLYTSGTTGQPKGCVLANSYFLEVARWYANLGGIGQLTTKGERMLTPLPIFHMNAMAYSFMAMLAVGGCLTALDRFHPKTWWADVAASGATCLHYLGVMPSILMALPETPQDRAHTARFGFGAGVDPNLQAAFEARFGFPLVEGWAMTETGAGAVIAANRPDRLIGCACLGRPGPELEVRIEDSEGQAAAQGELLVRRAGPNPRLGFFTEYYKDPQATAEAWAGGWLHTGDIVRQDASGNLFFVDRKKNVIRRSGENIAAVEVESILRSHPEVLAAGVAAVPDALRGDEVFACLRVATPRPGLAEDIASWALAQMAYYKVPAYIAFVEALPLTATQKIQRAELKTLALALLSDPATVATGHLKRRQVG